MADAASLEALSGRVFVMSHSPLPLSHDSEPQPDVAAYQPSVSVDALPTQALLVVEVYTQPTDGAYQACAVQPRGGSIRPASFPDVELLVESFSGGATDCYRSPAGEDRPR